MSQLNLSTRAYHRILKLARTIADLSGSEEIGSVHLSVKLAQTIAYFVGSEEIQSVHPMGAAQYRLKLMPG